jgi:protein-S-isoprenylcysteine O-methyltransferase Ste14
MPALMLAYAIFGLFMAIERRLRQDEAARTFQELPEDRGTTRLIGASYAFALSVGCLAPLLSHFRVGRLRGEKLSPIGLALMVLGLTLRVWAAQTLGRFYTRTLRVADDQTVVRRGPYRVVRHPGYAADLLLWLGFGLASRNAVVAMCIDLVMAVAYARRIQAEEAMLVEQLGDAYWEYQQATWRVVPLVY